MHLSDHSSGSGRRHPLEQAGLQAGQPELDGLHHHWYTYIYAHVYGVRVILKDCICIGVPCII